MKPSSFMPLDALYCHHDGNQQYVGFPDDKPLDIRLIVVHNRAYA